MKKETQTDVKVSGKQVTPAPKLTSGDRAYDKFVREAMHTVFKPKK